MKQLSLRPLNTSFLLSCCVMVNSISSLQNKEHIYTVHFDLVKNMILLEAEIEGQKGLLCLDFRKRGLLLNVDYLSIDGGDLTSRFVDQTIELNRHWPYDVRLGKWVKRFSVAGIADREFVDDLGLPILGIVGRQIFGNAEITIDYTVKTITIYALDKNGNRLADLFRHQVIIEPLPIFCTQNHNDEDHLSVAFHPIVKANMDKDTTVFQTPCLSCACCPGISGIVIINFVTAEISFWNESSPMQLTLLDKTIK